MTVLSSMRAAGLAVVLSLAATLAACTSSTVLDHCVPGASSVCACRSGLVGAQVCALDGTLGACDCRGCADGASYRCACTDGREGLATCGGGALGACACIDAMPALCAPGAQERCACPDGRPGVQRCRDDGTAGACVCPDDCDVEGRVIACSCPEWSIGTTRCEGGLWQSCACVAVDAAAYVPPDAAVVPDDASLTAEPSCPACGCERVVSPGTASPLPGSVTLPPAPIGAFAFEEGIVVVSAHGLARFDRSGELALERAMATEVRGADRSGDFFVTWTDYELELWSPSLERVRWTPLHDHCTAVVVLACHRALCTSSTTTTTYDLLSDTVWEGSTRLGSPSVAVPDHDALLVPGAGYVRWVDGEFVVVGGVLDAQPVAVGPAFALLDNGDVRSLAGCQTGDVATCFERVASLFRPWGGATWGSDHALYASSGARFVRFDPVTGESIEVTRDGGRSLVHDPWSNSLLVVSSTSMREVPLP